MIFLKKWFFLGLFLFGLIGTKNVWAQENTSVSFEAKIEKIINRLIEKTLIKIFDNHGQIIKINGL